MSRSQLNLRLDSELLEKLRDESRASGVPQAELVRRMLVERFGDAEGRVVETEGDRSRELTWDPPPSGPSRAGRVEYAPDYGAGFRCPLPACRHQQKGAGKCPRHGHTLVPVRL